MKKLIRIATPILALALVNAMPSFAQAVQNNAAAQTSPVAGTPQAQQGYHDGMTAAQLDRVVKRPLDAKVSPKYVHPPVKKDAQDEYRSSFMAGYQAQANQPQSGSM